MVSISSEVVREFREYERFATTALTAALLPVMRRYLDRLGRRTKRMGIRDRPRISNSFGSIVSLRAAKERPVGYPVLGSKRRCDRGVLHRHT